MAMIQCPECGIAASDVAPACPHCGYPIAANNPMAQLASAATQVSRTKHPSPRTGGRRLILIIVLTVVVSIPVLLLVKGDVEHPAGGNAALGIIVELLRIGMYVVLGGVVIWVIRRGVAQGMDEHDRKRR